MFYKDVSEELYRSHYQKQDRAQARKVVRVAMWAFVPLLLVDVGFHSLSLWLWILLGMRVAVWAYSWQLLRELGRTVDSPALDQMIFRWVVLVFLMQFISNASLPRDYYGHYMVDIWVSLMTLIVVPLPLAMLRAPVAGFVMASVLLLFYKQSDVFAYAASAALMLPASAITGHAIASYVHRYRRKLLSAEHAIDRQANTDPVTGVANWREFMRMAEAQVQQHLRQGSALSVLMIRIDNLSEIVQMQGPQAEEVILVEVTRRIHRVMRNHDCLARYGAEEFCLLLPDADDVAAEKIAQRTCATIVALPVAMHGKEIKISASNGISHLHAADTVDSLLKRASACWK